MSLSPHFSSFFVDYGILPNTVFFQHTGTLLFQQHVEKIRLLRVSASTRINMNPNMNMVLFFWTLRGFTHNRQKKLSM